VSAREDGWPVRVGQDPGSPRGPREGACARDLSALDHSARDRGRDRVGHREPGPADAGHRQRGPADAGHRQRGPADEGHRGRDRVSHREPGPADEGHRGWGRGDEGHRERGPTYEGHRRRVRVGADGCGRDYAGASVRRRHCCAECAQRMTKDRPGAGGPGRKAAGEGGRDAQGGRAQTAERIAAGTEMIIALPGPAPSGETQVTGSQPRLIRTVGEIATSMRGRAHRHERRPAQRRDLGISQYETVT